jgi:hypothetical protein
MRLLLRKTHWLRVDAHQTDGCRARSPFAEVASVDQTEATTINAIRRREVARQADESLGS